MASPTNSTLLQFDRAFHSTDKVQGYTHDFYKYPARFSPHFVRFFLNALTEPGDYVLDPFMGGGTTIVEAAASGRFAIGSDVNHLARFVTRAKTTPLSRRDVSEIHSWVENVRATVAGEKLDASVTESPIKNMPLSAYPFFKTATELAESLRFPRRRQFARCALLRVGQLALDARTSIPETEYLMDKLAHRVELMLGGMSDFISAVKESGAPKNKVTSTRHLLSYPASNGSLAHSLRRRDISPRLVLTSPPYPGVHVLYHRWQIQGRRETPAPYWIADVRDGQNGSYYTMGGRTPAGLDNYFTGLSDAFRNIRQIIAPDAKVVQLVAFSDTVSQLPRYLDAMHRAGFEETSAGGIDSQRVRSVPNRKWYNNQRAENDASREVLLIHRPAI